MWDYDEYLVCQHNIYETKWRKVSLSNISFQLAIIIDELWGCLQRTSTPRVNLIAQMMWTFSTCWNFNKRMNMELWHDID